ncbi:MAG: FG-GAP-like repeat-containing protein [Hyphomicrobiales bacterium]
MKLTKTNKYKNLNVVKLASVGVLGSILAACGGSNSTVGNASVKITGIAKEDETLTVDFSGSGTSNVAYQWQRGGVDIVGANNAIYVLNQVDVGAEITVLVNYTNADGTSDHVNSSATSAVVNVNDAPVNNLGISGVFTEDQTLSAFTNIIDEDGLPATYAYQWQRGGVDIAGATNKNYVLVQADVGEKITLVVSYTDGQGTPEIVSFTDTTLIANVNDTGEVIISGNAKLGETITANVSDEDGVGTMSYQWQRGGVNIVGAADEDYTIVLADVGADISVIVTYTDDNGTIETVDSLDTDSATVPVGLISVLDLNSLDGSNGFRIDGVNISDRSGKSVSNAGDLNGDGFDDIIIGATAADNGPSPANLSSGSGYVLFGSADGYTPNVSLSVLDGTNGFRLDGAKKDDDAGYSVSSAGDVNGDGYDDIIIAAPEADHNGKANNGSSYVVFGGREGFLANKNLSTLDGSDGFRLDGVNINDQAGRQVSSAGDINDDGYDDIIIGASKADNNINGSGSSFVVFGKAGGFAAGMNLSTLDGENGFRLDGGGIADYSGVSVANAGDVNGDGYDDIIIGANGAENNSGSSYVVFGNKNGYDPTLDLDNLGLNGFEIGGEVGAAGHDYSGGSVASAGDVNGDGYDDIIIGATHADGSVDTSGNAYVIYGRFNNTDIDLSLLNGYSGSKISGVSVGNLTGGSVSSAGDINGDGYDDIIIGAANADYNGRANSGSSYVVFGQKNGLGPNFILSAMDGSDGFRIDGGKAVDLSGTSVSAAGDVNADGYDDLIVGAYAADDGGVTSGSTYIIYGGTQFSASAQDASFGDDIVTGTVFNDVLNGGDGDDVVNGLGGRDVIKGGNGTDNITGGESGDRIWGGGGTDVFNFTAGDSSPAWFFGGGGAEIYSHDIIYDFKTGDGTHISETINITGDTTIASNTLAVNGTDGIYDIGGTFIKSHTIADGLITFDDNDVFGAKLEISSRSDVAAAVNYLQLQDFGDAGTTVAFNVGADCFIFTQGDDTGTNNLDTLVELEGAYVDALVSSNGIGEFDLLIA